MFSPGAAGQAGPWHGGPAGDSRPRGVHPADADPDRVLTPTTIFAPGVLINPSDGGEGEPPSFAGPGGAPPAYGAPHGYVPFPGQEPWSAPGAVPPPGPFPMTAPGPGNGFAGPGGYPPGPPPAPGAYPGADGFAGQGPFPPGNAFPAPGGYPAAGGPAPGGPAPGGPAPGGPVGYGTPGYPPVGYPAAGFDPYPANGGAPLADGPGAPPPGFPGGPGYGPQPGPQFPGRSPVPGYGQAPGHDPWQRPPGGHAPDGFAPPAGERGPGGPPFVGAPGPAVPGPGSYAGPGGYPGFPPGHGFAGQPGTPPGQSPYPGPAGPPAAGGYARPGEQHAPYPEYQSWHPRGAPGGYPAPDGHAEAVSDGYAYVIREDDPAASAPSRDRARHRGRGLGEWSAGNDPAVSPEKAADTVGTLTAAMRAITAGAAGQRQPGARVTSTETAGSAAGPAKPGSAATATASGDAGRPGPAESAGPASLAGAGGKARAAEEAGGLDPDPGPAYGPDDPAYGPPGPDWYKRREQQRAARTEDSEPRTDDDDADAPAARGPFEPLRTGSERDAAGNAGYLAAGDEPSRDGYDDALPEVPGYQPLDPEIPDLLDFGLPSDPEAGALGQMRDLYQTAETISPADFDSHFDQLLERQRQLISEYFKESGGAEPPLTPAPAETAAPEPSAPFVPLGFDTAESLAALRGELRGAP